MQTAAIPACTPPLQEGNGAALYSRLPVKNVFHAMTGAVLLLVLAQAFPAAIRTTGLATAFGIGAALFAGTAQIVFTWLTAATGDPLSPVWYVTVMNLVSAVATVMLLRRSAAHAIPTLARA